MTAESFIGHLIKWPIIINTAFFKNKLSACYYAVIIITAFF